MEPSIRIANLTKRYDDFALDDVSFELPAGGIMGFVGENGAGKTTTIKLILNLITRDAGSIEVFGMDHIADERRIKADVGVVLDQCAFHDMLRPCDVSRILSRVFSTWDETRYDELLGSFGLPKAKTVKEFSSGMKTKLSIAAALAHRPRLLILDEPTSGLDPVARGEILDIFLDFIQAEENSILFSSHITSDLERVADYITFIRHGRIVMSEPKDTLLESYGLLHCGAADLERVDVSAIAGVRKNRFGCDALVRDKRTLRGTHPDLLFDDAAIEDIMTLHGKEVSR